MTTPRRWPFIGFPHNSEKFWSIILKYIEDRGNDPIIQDRIVYPIIATLGKKIVFYIKKRSIK